MSEVKLGHAFCSETGGINGEPGDQTGRELRVSDWYNNGTGWFAVFRWKNAKQADKFATFIEKCVSNKLIGYGQNTRLMLDNELSIINYEVEKLTKKVNCDCSSLVACGVRAIAGKEVLSADMYTAIEDDLLTKTGLFKRLDSSKYTGNSDKLQRGDILLKKGHTAVVLTDGKAIAIPSKVMLTQVRGSKSKVIGKAKSLCAINVRTNPSTEYGTIITTLEKDTVVDVYAVDKKGHADKDGWIFTSAGGWSSNRNSRYFKVELDGDESDASNVYNNSNLSDTDNTSGEGDTNITDTTNMSSPKEKPKEIALEEIMFEIKLVVKNLLDEVGLGSLTESEEWSAFESKVKASINEN